MKGKYLSDCFEIIDYDDGDCEVEIDIKLGCINLIAAGCGAGKTTFIKNVISKAYDDILFLIDTRVGAEQLIDEMQGYDITVMTYAQYAMMVQHHPENDRWEYGSCTIICDEFHNLINFSKWDNNSIHKLANDLIFTRFFHNDCIVLALSATPDVIFYEYGSLVHEIVINEEIMHYETYDVEYYSNIFHIIKNIHPGERGIIYVPRITQIIKVEEHLRNMGIKVSSIWSKNNEQYWLSEEQVAVREYVIKNRKVPDNIDVLIINKSCETCISIYNNIDFMIIHSTIPDTQEQARGRFRGDLKILYLLDKEEPDCFAELNLEGKWLSKKLYKQDKETLCQELNFRDNRNRLIGWNTIKKILIDNGYIVSDKKNDNVRFSIIYQFDEY
jgi:hypothetical protein